MQKTGGGRRDEVPRLLSRPTPAWRVLVALAAAVLIPTTLAETDGDSADRERPAFGPVVGGRLAHVSGGGLDLLGDVWADLPLGSPGSGQFFTSWFTRSAISGTSSDFAFNVRDLEYSANLGWRRPWLGHVLSFGAGQRGRVEVDRVGDAWVRYVALGVSSRHFRRAAHPEAPVDRLSWSLTAGPVIEETAVRADAVIQGAARARLAGDRLTFELELDGLVDGGQTDLDVTLGPSVVFPLAGGRRIALYVHYLDAGNPLGILGDAWLAGFEFSETPTGFTASHGTRGEGISGADIGGTIALGAGQDHRESAQLLLRFLAPPLPGELRIAFSLDSNVLTGDTTDELYYLYDVGVERVLRYRPGTGSARAVAGAYFYHRSNHQLDRAGTVTSINVAEAGLESPGWHARGPRQAGRHGAVDGRVRVGYLINSDFGLDHRWHARAGLRWQTPLEFGGVVPFLRAEAEFGDVNRRTFGMGVFIDAFEIQLEHRTDDQYFDVDHEATLLTAGYAF